MLVSVSKVTIFVSQLINYIDMNFKNLDNTDIFDDFFQQYSSRINLSVQLNGYSSNYKGNTEIFRTLNDWGDPNYTYLDNTPYTNWCVEDHPLEIVRSVNCCKRCCFSKDEEFAIIAHEIGHIEITITSRSKGGLEEEIEADKFAVKLGLKNELINALQKMIGAEINPAKEDEMNKRICELTKYP